MSAQRSSPQTLRIGLVQARVSEDTEVNLRLTEQYVAEAAGGGAQVVCLEELFAMRYFAQWKRSQSRSLAQRIPGSLSRFLAATAQKHRVTLVGGSIYEKGRGGQSFNTALVYDSQGRRIGKYRKMHIPDDPGYYEQYYFAPGNLGYLQVPVSGVVIAPLICYDQWFPEAARANALKGAQILVYPTAIGWSRELRVHEPSSARRWEQAMCAHASMNGVFAVAINRVGREGGLTFWGRSFIADPYGDVVARASGSRSEVLVVDIDLAKVHESQMGWGFLRNRRPTSYRDLIR